MNGPHNATDWYDATRNPVTDVTDGLQETL